MNQHLNDFEDIDDFEGIDDVDGFNGDDFDSTVDIEDMDEDEIEMYSVEESDEFTSISDSFTDIDDFTSFDDSVEEQESIDDDLDFIDDILDNSDDEMTFDALMYKISEENPMSKELVTVTSTLATIKQQENNLSVAIGDLCNLADDKLDGKIDYKFTSSIMRNRPDIVNSRVDSYMLPKLAEIYENKLDKEISCRQVAVTMAGALQRVDGRTVEELYSYVQSSLEQYEEYMQEKQSASANKKNKIISEFKRYLEDNYQDLKELQGAEEIVFVRNVYLEGEDFKFICGKCGEVVEQKYPFAKLNFILKSQKAQKKIEVKLGSNICTHCGAGNILPETAADRIQKVADDDKELFESYFNYVSRRQDITFVSVTPSYVLMRNALPNIYTTVEIDEEEPVLEKQDIQVGDAVKRYLEKVNLFRQFRADHNSLELLDKVVSFFINMKSLDYQEMYKKAYLTALNLLSENQFVRSILYRTESFRKAQFVCVDIAEKIAMELKEGSYNGETLDLYMESLYRMIDGDINNVMREGVFLENGLEQFIKDLHQTKDNIRSIAVNEKELIELKELLRSQIPILGLLPIENEPKLNSDLLTIFGEDKEIMDLINQLTRKLLVTYSSGEMIAWLSTKKPHTNAFSVFLKENSSLAEVAKKASKYMANCMNSMIKHGMPDYVPKLKTIEKDDHDIGDYMLDAFTACKNIKEINCINMLLGAVQKSDLKSFVYYSKMFISCDFKGQESFSEFNKNLAYIVEQLEDVVSELGYLADDMSDYAKIKYIFGEYVTEDEIKYALDKNIFNEIPTYVLEREEGEDIDTYFDRVKSTEDVLSRDADWFYKHSKLLFRLEALNKVVLRTNTTGVSMLNNLYMNAIVECMSQDTNLETITSYFVLRPEVFLDLDLKKYSMQEAILSDLNDYNAYIALIRSCIFPEDSLREMVEYVGDKYKENLLLVTQLKANENLILDLQNALDDTQKEFMFS